MTKFYVLCDLHKGGLTTLYFTEMTEWNKYYRENKNNIRKVIKCGLA